MRGWWRGPPYNPMADSEWIFLGEKTRAGLQNSSNTICGTTENVLCHLHRIKSEFLPPTHPFSPKLLSPSCVCVAGHPSVFTVLLFVTVARGRAACLTGG